MQIEGPTTANSAPEYNGPKLVSLTGSRVHYPAMIGQKSTGITRCAPYGRMGARPMRLRFTSEPKWDVNCKTCMKIGAPTQTAETPRPGM